MKTMKLLQIPALAATAFGVTLLTAAEPGQEPPRRPGSPGEPGRVQRIVQGQPRPGGVPVEMVLNAEQRAQFREEIEAQRDKQRELDEKAAKLRREFEDALFAEKLEEKVVREKSAALAEVDAERSLIRARAFAKVRPSLTDEQLERLKNLRPESGWGPRLPEGQFRRPGEGGPGPGERPERPRPPRPPEGGQPGDVLPPLAPPPPQAPPTPAPK